MTSLMVFRVLLYNAFLTVGVSGVNLTLTPTDGSYCTSQNLTMTCTIVGGHPPDPARDLIFLHDSEPVNKTMVTKVTNTTAEYLITNLIPLKNKFYVTCCYKTCTGDANNASELVKNYVKPVPVQNFRCVVLGINFGPVKCTWTYGVNYHNSYNYPTITFIWRNSSRYNWNILPRSLSNSSAGLGSSEVNYGTSEVGVNISSLYCGNSVFTTRFKDVKIVQLPAVTGLSGYATNSSCVHLSWDPTQYNYIGKQYVVNCTNDWHIPRVMSFNATQSVVAATVCDLIPATWYNCSMWVKVIPVPILMKSSTWSQDQSTHVRTLDDVPEDSPTVVTGAYSWEEETCDPTRQTGYVWIYWKPISNILMNGMANGTLVTYNTSGNLATISHLYTVSSDSVRLQLDCKNVGQVHLQSVNNVGVSNPPSALLVYPPVLDIPELIVEENNGLSTSNVMYLEWRPQEQRIVNSYNVTIFYALRKGQTCDPNFLGPVSWKVETGGKNKTTIRVTDKPHCYGISVHTNTGSSGLRWTDCVYSRKKVPQPPDDVSAAVGEADDSLVVRWTKIPCSKGQPYISQYEVGYCPVDSSRQCAGSLKTQMCPGNSSSVVLVNLETKTDYKVNVRALSRSFQTGNWSTTINATTFEKQGIAAGALVGIILGSVVGIVILFGVAGLCIRKMRTNWNTPKQIADIVVYPEPRTTDRITTPPDGHQDENSSYDHSNSFPRINAGYSETTDEETEVKQPIGDYVKVHTSPADSNQNPDEVHFSRADTDQDDNRNITDETLNSAQSKDKNNGTFHLKIDEDKIMIQLVDFKVKQDLDKEQLDSFEHQTKIERDVSEVMHGVLDVIHNTCSPYVAPDSIKHLPATPILQQGDLETPNTSKSETEEIKPDVSCSTTEAQRDIPGIKHNTCSPYVTPESMKQFSPTMASNHVDIKQTQTPGYVGWKTNDEQRQMELNFQNDPDVNHIFIRETSDSNFETVHSDYDTNTMSVRKLNFEPIMFSAKPNTEGYVHASMPLVGYAQLKTLSAESRLASANVGISSQTLSVGSSYHSENSSGMPMSNCSATVLPLTEQQADGNLPIHVPVMGGYITDQQAGGNLPIHVPVMGGYITEQQADDNLRIHVPVNNGYITEQQADDNLPIHVPVKNGYITDQQADDNLPIHVPVKNGYITDQQADDNLPIHLPVKNGYITDQQADDNLRKHVSVVNGYITEQQADDSLPIHVPVMGGYITEQQANDNLRIHVPVKNGYITDQQADDKPRVQAPGMDGYITDTQVMCLQVSSSNNDSLQGAYRG